MDKNQKKIFFTVLLCISVFFLVLCFGGFIVNYQNGILLKNNDMNNDKLKLLGYQTDNSLGLAILLLVLLASYTIQIFKNNRIINITTLALSTVVFIFSLIAIFHVTSFAEIDGSNTVNDSVLASASLFQSNLVQVCFPALTAALSNLYLLLTNRKENV